MSTRDPSQQHMSTRDPSPTEMQTRDANPNTCRRATQVPTKVDSQPKSKQSSTRDPNPKHVGKRSKAHAIQQTKVDSIKIQQMFDMRHKSRTLSMRYRRDPNPRNVDATQNDATQTTNRHDLTICFDTRISNLFPNQLSIRRTPGTNQSTSILRRTRTNPLPGPMGTRSMLRTWTKIGSERKWVAFVSPRRVLHRAPCFSRVASWAPWIVLKCCPPMFSPCRILDRASTSFPS